MTETSIDAFARILEENADADEILRRTVVAVAQEPDVAWAGIAFVDGEELVLGPTSGVSNEARRVRVPITYRGTRVGELLVDGAPDLALLEALARRVAPYVLIGWDTGGEAWEP